MGKAIKSLFYLAGKIRERGNDRKERMSRRLTGSLVLRGRKAVREIDNNSRQAVILQYRTLMELISKNRDTEFGRDHGFSDIHNLADYRERVPLTEYSDYEPFIRRMMDGEERILTEDAPRFYAQTAGSAGAVKNIPVSQEELDKYTRYSAEAAFGVADEYYRNTTGRGVPAGPGMTTVEWKVTTTDRGAEKGMISGTLMKSMKDYVPYLLSSPWEVINPEEEMDMKYLKARLALAEKDLSFMNSAFMTGLVDFMDYIRDNYKMLCADIRDGSINSDVDVPDRVRTILEGQIKPDPARADDLMYEFEQGFDTPVIPRIWPRMSWIGGIGTGSFFPYTRKLRAYSGKSIPFNNMCYAASESFMAVARHMGDESYVLVPDGGFYEFIPARDNGESKILTIEELEVGEDYEVIITNLSGLYRYRIHDVVRVTGFYNEAPLIRFVYRRDQLCSIAGEKTNEDALRWAVDEFSLEMSTRVNDYSLYADTDTSPGHYVVFIEPDSIIPEGSLDRCRDVMETKLMNANPSYGDKIRGKILAPLELVVLQQQTYQLYRDIQIMHGASANQLKPVRIIDNEEKKKFFFGLKENY